MSMYFLDKIIIIIILYFMLNSDNHIGFIGILTLIFITLKLCHIIYWKWIWVLSPLWIGLAITVIIFFIFLILTIISENKYGGY